MIRAVRPTERPSARRRKRAEKPEQAPETFDQQLNTRGVAAKQMSGEILLLACGALAREILDVIKANDWQHMTLTCLPAILHVYPERIPDAVREAVAQHKGNFDKIYLVYADCGTGGKLFDLCNDLGIEMVKGPHCYSFFEGNDNFHRRAGDEITTYYLTDFLVRQFDAFVWKPLGLDRNPELRDAYFANYTKLVYQAQIDDPALREQAEGYAKKLGLEYEYRFTGYGDLETTIRDWSGR